MLNFNFSHQNANHLSSETFSLTSPFFQQPDMLWGQRSFFSSLLSISWSRHLSYKPLPRCNYVGSRILLYFGNFQWEREVIQHKWASNPWGKPCTLLLLSLSHPGNRWMRMKMRITSKMCSARCCTNITWPSNRRHKFTSLPAKSQRENLSFCFSNEGWTKDWFGCISFDFNPQRNKDGCC